MCLKGTKIFESAHFWTEYTDVLSRIITTECYSLLETRSLNQSGCFIRAFVQGRIQKFLHGVSLKI